MSTHSACWPRGVASRRRPASRKTVRVSAVAENSGDRLVTGSGAANTLECVWMLHGCTMATPSVSRAVPPTSHLRRAVITTKATVSTGAKMNSKACSALAPLTRDHQGVVQLRPPITADPAKVEGIEQSPRGQEAVGEVHVPRDVVVPIEPTPEGVAHGDHGEQHQHDDEAADDESVASAEPPRRAVTHHVPYERSASHQVPQEQAPEPRHVGGDEDASHGQKKADTDAHPQRRRQHGLGIGPTGLLTQPHHHLAPSAGAEEEHSHQGEQLEDVSHERRL